MRCISVCTLTILVVGTASPAFPQSRVYTNDDLGKRLARTRQITPEELAALRANQFRLPQRFDGPTVVILHSDPGPPFGSEFPPIAPLSSQPWIVESTYPWERPWGFHTFSSVSIPPTGATVRSGNQASPAGGRRGRR